MNQNETSAENLDWWIGKQQEMKQQAEERLASLRQQKANRAKSSSSEEYSDWLDDAIEREAHAVDHFDKSITLAKHFRSLAQDNGLHDPRRG